MAYDDLPKGIKNLEELLRHPLLAEGLDGLKYQCYINLGMAYQELKSNYNALKYYYKALQIQEADFGTWMRLSKICLQKKYFEQAEFSLQMALQYIPSIVYERTLYEQMIHVAYIKNSFEECLKKIDFLERKEPLSEKILLLKAYCYRNLK